MNLPVGAVVLYTIHRYLPQYSASGARPRIDYAGAALFTAALVPILVGPCPRCEVGGWTAVAELVPRSPGQLLVAAATAFDA